MRLKVVFFLGILALAATFLSSCGAMIAMNVAAEAGPEAERTLPAAPALEENDPSPVLDLEQARDLAVAYAAQRTGSPVPEGTWTRQDTTPVDLVGASEALYTLGPWVVKVSAPVVAPAQRTFSIVIDHLTAVFRWEGSVDAGGNVSETNFTAGVPAPQPGSLPGDLEQAPESWVGVVISNPPGAQFDDFFQMLDQDGTRCGIDSLDEAVRDQIKAYRDSGILLKVYGKMQEGIDAYGMQITVTRLEEYQP
jgi:hypothetical protein